MWNEHFNPFRPEINIFELMCCMKLTFCCIVREINILAVMHKPEISILTYLDLKSAFLSLCIAWNWHFACFLREINICAITCYRKIDTLTTFDLKSTNWAYVCCVELTFCCLLSEIKVLAVTASRSFVMVNRGKILTYNKGLS